MCSFCFRTIEHNSHDSTWVPGVMFKKQTVEVPLTWSFESKWMHSRLVLAVNVNLFLFLYQSPSLGIRSLVAKARGVSGRKSEVCEISREVLLKRALPNRLD